MCSIIHQILVCLNKPCALRLCYESRLLYYVVYIHTSYTVVYDNCARVLYRCTTSASRGLVCLLSLIVNSLVLDIIFMYP